MVLLANKEHAATILRNFAAFMLDDNAASRKITDWNYLITLIERVESIVYLSYPAFKVTITGDVCEITVTPHVSRYCLAELKTFPVIRESANTKTEAVVYALDTFINWYRIHKELLQ
jgi:hypothetical protein